MCKLSIVTKVFRLSEHKNFFIFELLLIRGFNLSFDEAVIMVLMKIICQVWKGKIAELIRTAQKLAQTTLNYWKEEE